MRKIRGFNKIRTRKSKNFRTFCNRRIVSMISAISSNLSQLKMSSRINCEFPSSERVRSRRKTPKYGTQKRGFFLAVRSHARQRGQFDSGLHSLNRKVSSSTPSTVSPHSPAKARGISSHIWKMRVLPSMFASSAKRKSTLTRRQQKTWCCSFGVHGVGRPT